MIIEWTAGLGKLFHDADLLMVLISDGNLSVEHIHDACLTRLLIYEVQYVQDTKLVKLTYRPVFVSFRKIVIPSGDNLRSKK